jgi:hypothetical protein
MKIRALLVHGIGVHDDRWAVSIIEKLEKRVASKLSQIAPGVSAGPIGDVIEIRAFNWDNLFHERQMILQGVLSAQSHPTVLRNTQAFTNPFSLVSNWGMKLASSWFTTKVRPLQTKVVTQFIADILAYLNEDAAKLVHTHLDKALSAWKAESGEKAPMTFIAHSLGTVISSNYIYDRTKGGKGFDKHVVLENLFTIGSPIALFALKYGNDPDAFSAPVRVETQEGRGLNILDDDDPVGMPLKGLNEAYKSVVHQDIQVDAGVYGASHIGYFDNAAVMDLIAHKLALDWLRHNAALPADKIRALISDFDQKAG